MIDLVPARAPSTYSAHVRREQGMKWSSASDCSNPGSEEVGP